SLPNDIFWANARSVAAVTAGVFVVGVVFYLLLLQDRIRGLRQWLFLLGLAGTVLCYSVVLLALAPFLVNALIEYLGGRNYTPPQFSPAFQVTLFYAVTLGGAFAIFSASNGFVAGLFSLSWRRIWALARLTAFEVLRNRILWAYAGIALLFLFA